MGDLETAKEQTLARHEARISPTGVEPGKTPPEPMATNPDATIVHIGSYIEQIRDLSVRDSSWATTFYLWFRWTGAAEVEPGESFVVVDGVVDDKQRLVTWDNGDDHYRKYLVRATITKFFDTTRFSLDDHLLGLFIEDGARDSTKVRFLADDKESNVSSRVNIPGYSLYKQQVLVKPHTYKSTHGDPQLPPDYHATFAQYIHGIWIIRPDVSYFLKLFLALYAGLALSMSVFFIKPTDVDPRFGLAGGAFFGVVANMYLTNSLVPDSGVMTVVDVVNGVGLLTIFLTVAQSVISLYLYDILEQEEASRRFDRLTIAVLFPCVILFNAMIPLTGIAHYS
jgi:hypothetical protein